MKLQQLRYIIEVVNQDLNITAASEQLHTSQPGISKQIRLLEDELGLRIFDRSGKHLVRVTPEGEAVLSYARRILQDTDNIHRVAGEYKDHKTGSLTLGTTHTQARYVLPSVIRAFRDQYPQVSLQIQQGSPRQIAQWAARGEVDIAIATEAMNEFEDLVLMPCYNWNRSVVVPPKHPLTTSSKITLENIAQFPIVTYVLGFTGRSRFDQAFIDADLNPKIVLTAVDADVIKTYVRLGFGIGVVANMAIDKQDKDLTAVDVGHLFAANTTNLCIRRGSYLRQYMYDFIQLFCEHLSKDVVDDFIDAKSAEEARRLQEKIKPKVPNC